MSAKALPRKRKRSRPAGGGRKLLRSEYPHHVWAIDFQFDQTIDGQADPAEFIDHVQELKRSAIRLGRRCKAVDVIDTIEVPPAPARLTSFYLNHLGLNGAT